MSNRHHAEKSEAREFAAAHGVNYTTALRVVEELHDPLALRSFLAANQDLTGHQGEFARAAALDPTFPGGRGSADAAQAWADRAFGRFDLQAALVIHLWEQSESMFIPWLRKLRFEPALSFTEGRRELLSFSDYPDGADLEAVLTHLAERGASPAAAYYAKYAWVDRWINSIPQEGPDYFERPSPEISGFDHRFFVQIVRELPELKSGGGVTIDYGYGYYVADAPDAREEMGVFWAFSPDEPIGFEPSRVFEAMRIDLPLEVDGTQHEYLILKAK